MIINAAFINSVFVFVNVSDWLKTFLYVQAEPLLQSNSNSLTPCRAFIITD